MTRSKRYWSAQDGPEYDDFGNEYSKRPSRAEHERTKYREWKLHEMWRGEALARVLKREYEITAAEYFEAGVRICQ